MKTKSNISLYRYFFVGVLFLSSIALSLPARGEALVVTLGSIPDRVRKQNPDLAAARYRIAEAIGQLKQSGRRSNPTLDIDVTQGTDIREHSVRVGTSQKFPVTDRLRIEKKLSLTLVKAAEAEVRNVQRQLIAEGRNLLIKILATREQKKLIAQQTTVAKQLADFIGKAAEKGESSALDAGQARLEAMQLNNSIQQLEAEEASLIGQLKPLLGMRISTPLVVGGILPSLDAGRVSTASTDPSRRPDLRAAKLQAQAAAENAQLERSRKYDDIEMGISAEMERSEDAPSGYERERSIGFSIKIPLPLHNENEGAVEAADARTKRKKKEVQALAHNIRHEAATARAEMREWAKLAQQVSNDLLPLAEKQSELAEQAYRNGQGDLQATLRTREQLLKLAAAKLNAVRDYHLARNRYLAALAK